MYVCCDYSTLLLQDMAATSDAPFLPPLLSLLDRLNSDPQFVPSLPERVMVDIVSATATVVELCCIRELRVTTRVNASLQERVDAIRRTFYSGQLRLPRYIYTGVCTCMCIRIMYVYTSMLTYTFKYAALVVTACECVCIYGSAYQHTYIPVCSK